MNWYNQYSMQNVSIISATCVSVRLFERETPKVKWLRSGRGTGRTCFWRIRTTKHTKPHSLRWSRPKRLSRNTSREKKNCSWAKQTMKYNMTSCQSAGFYTLRQLITWELLDIRLQQRTPFLRTRAAEQSEGPRVNTTTGSSLIQHVATRTAELQWPENNSFISNKRLRCLSARPDPTPSGDKTRANVSFI